MVGVRMGVVYLILLVPFEHSKFEITIISSYIPFLLSLKEIYVKEAYTEEQHIKTPVQSASKVSSGSIHFLHEYVK